MTLFCVYQVSQHSWLIYLLCFRSLLRQSGPLRVSFTSLPSDSGGKLLVLPYEPPSSACWAPSLPSLPFSSWPHAALNTGISVLRYRKEWATVHTLQREKRLFSMGQVFFSSNEWTWFEHFLFWSVFLRFRSCFRRRMARFSISDPPPAWREETFLRIWSSTRLPKPRRPKRKLVRKK